MKELIWEQGACSELLIQEVLSPLLEIVYLYKESGNYNNIPGTQEDGWDYFEKRFHDIRRALHKNLYITNAVYNKVLRIIEEMQTFVRSFSGAEGLPERYFELNYNLNHYRVGHSLKEDDGGEAFQMAAENGMLSYIPTEEDSRKRKAYFADLEERNKQQNFHHDEDDFFMEELAYTLRLVFLNDIREMA